MTNQQAGKAVPTNTAGSSEGASESVTRQAGRGGLAVAFAKVYFILQGLVQQVALPRLLGLDGYGAWSTVNSIASLSYNPVVSMSIQGASRALAEATPEERPAALRRVLSLHAVFAVLFAAGFYWLAPGLLQMAGAPHLTTALRLLCPALFIYALYAPLIGALNGQRRFTYQAGFDMLAATIRTLGLIVGALLFAKRGLGVEGAASGFVIGMSGLLLLAVAVVGIGRRGPGGVSAGDHVLFVLPVLVGQVLLNLLLQADLTLLRRFAADAALAQGLSIAAADPLVGAYRATQLFSFLPYQLLISVNFILFPMLATAVRDDDRAAIARYVATGVRIALVIAGLMAGVTSGLSNALLEVVFGARAAELGGRSLELLALGFGAFAIFGVLTTVLNSLQRQFSSALVTGLAALVVALLCFARVRGSSFDESLLFRTASATSIGLLFATLGAGVLVRQAAGAVVAPASAGRVLLATIATVAFGRMLSPHGVVRTFGCAATLSSFYFGVLLLTRELGASDLALVRAVLARGKK